MGNYGDVSIKTNSKFLKIEAGNPRDIRLMNETPTELFKHQRTGQAPAPCGGSMCDYCIKGDQPMQKFMTNVYDHKDQKVMLWEYGTGVAKQLRAIDGALEEEGRSIMNADLKIEATGAGKEKRYTITPRGNSKPIPTGVILHKIDPGLA